MEIGIVGPGAIGLLFAFYLEKNQQAVTLYTRTVEQAERLNECGITCVHNGVRETVYPLVSPLEDIKNKTHDYTFVAVKQYHLEAICPYLQENRLIFLQNGMGHLHILQQMQNTSVAVGIVEHGAKKENISTVHHTGIGSTKFGLIHGEEEQFESLFTAFSSSLFPIVIEKDWKQTMLHKLVVNACINPLTALFGVQNGELLTNPSFYKVMKQVFSEVMEIVGDSKCGEYWERVCTVCKNTAHNTSSMLMDVQNNRKTEIDAIVGYLIREAEQQQKSVPTLSFLYHSIKGLER
ncbi:2-dehydropantoate 2-reductase [Bacillus sp. 3103sda1]|uniref:2-dehydropantoate 2-reductase n=1 Tax=Bacillus sp. 3103sda1 TaxID=2953808 RepID=UPI0020A1E2B5|nr:2-dehydropantoate 2-reductase [Bacillus sp. 3103sda1]MCP1124835.1 2-dehydropantoate 2-reductase [Bacillus sp. 3103sda1]